MATDFQINGKAVHSDAPPATPVVVSGMSEVPQAGDIFACTPGVTGRLPYLFGV